MASINELKNQCLGLILTKQQDEATEIIAEKIENSNKIYTIKNDLKTEIWFYEDGIYKPNGMSKIKEITRKILDVAYTSHRVNNVIEKICADTYIEEDKFFNINYLDEIPVLNGILNLKTLELTEFTSNKIFFNKLPVIYNPLAKCPLIDKFLEDVLKCKEDKKVIYELLGYCLWKEHFIEKAIMFVGEGRNGKGKTLNLVKRFLGAENCCNIGLNNLKSDSFSVCELFGKLVNLAGDLDNFALKETGLLKSVTGRDMIEAKRKFLRELYFVNYSKQIFACNELPKVYDMSLGFWSRWILLEFPYIFISKKEYEKLDEIQKEKYKIRDTDIIEKITTEEELSGLLNRAIEYLHKLLEQKDFSYTKGTKEVKDLWIRKSDSFTSFCMDNIKESEFEFITKSELRQKFSKYCKKHNLKGTSDKAIKVTLESLYGAESVQPRGYQGDIEVAGWRGITWIKPQKMITEWDSPENSEEIEDKVY